MGVVIGETAILGDDVTLYQGVTLGGVMPAVDSALQRSVKRHPTLGKGVIVGSGAQILGDIEIGSYAKVGANAVVTKPVASGAVVVGNPAQEVKREVSVDSAEGLGGREESFVPYGHVKDCASHHDIFERMERWEKRMEVLEKAYKESARKGEGEEVDS
jgi:serine O-acetyltransferase